MKKYIGSKNETNVGDDTKESNDPCCLLFLFAFGDVDTFSVFFFFYPKLFWFENQ